MLEIRATPSQLRVGHMVFDRAYYRGMRLGYSDPNESIKAKAFGFGIGEGWGGGIALRVAYGRWGENTPYLINGYYAVSYINWMNEQIAAVGAPEPSGTDYALGRREENFG